MRPLFPCAKYSADAVPQVSHPARSRLQVFPKDLHGAWAEKNHPKRTKHVVAGFSMWGCFTKQHGWTNQTNGILPRKMEENGIFQNRRWLCVSKVLSSKRWTVGIWEGRVSGLWQVEQQRYQPDSNHRVYGLDAGWILNWCNNTTCRDCYCVNC